MVAVKALIVAVAASLAVSLPTSDPNEFARSQLPLRTEEELIDIDPSLSFNYRYEVKSDDTRDEKQHQESLDNGVLVGSYSLVQPDGTLRTVNYRADGKSGFQAEVSYQEGFADPIASTSGLVKSSGGAGLSSSSDSRFDSGVSGSAFSGSSSQLSSGGSSSANFNQQGSRSSPPTVFSGTSGSFGSRTSSQSTTGSRTSFTGSSSSGPDIQGASPANVGAGSQPSQFSASSRQQGSSFSGSTSSTRASSFPSGSSSVGSPAFGASASTAGVTGSGSTALQSPSRGFFDQSSQSSGSTGSTFSSGSSSSSQGSTASVQGDIHQGSPVFRSSPSQSQFSLPQTSGSFQSSSQGSNIQTGADSVQGQVGSPFSSSSVRSSSNTGSSDSGTAFQSGLSFQTSGGSGINSQGSGITTDIISGSLFVTNENLEGIDAVELARNGFTGEAYAYKLVPVPITQ